MAIDFVICPVCQQSETVFRHGKSSTGARRYRCSRCRCTFQRHYRHQVHVADTRVLITVLAQNGSSASHTARLLGISPHTVQAELAKHRSR